MNRSDFARFFAKVHRVPITGCWVWVGALSHRYGQFSVTGRRDGVRGAHIALYEALYGPVPDGFELDHVCMNTRCVNPAHLDVVTPQENVRRFRATKTHCKNGHPMTPENTLRSKGNNLAGFVIRCVICTRESNRRGSQKARDAQRRRVA